MLHMHMLLDFWVDFNCDGEKPQKNLNQTSKLLANTEEELKKCQYALKEKSFIIFEQRKAGIVIYHSF
jgi:kinesin family protein 11